LESQKGNSGSVTQAEADALTPWFHSIDLGGGVLTKGGKSVDTIRREADIAFRYGVEGKSVLDLGAWDGAFSFEAERRGAMRVVACDHFCWVGAGPGKKAAFDLAKRSLGSKVEEKISTIEQLDVSDLGMFDVVLFMGILYHLKNPLLGLERAAALTHDLIVVETVVSLNLSDKPAMVFFLGAELYDDETNWWAPNVACVEAMLKAVGFKTIEEPVIYAPPKEIRLRTLYLKQKRVVYTGIKALLRVAGFGTIGKSKTKTTGSDVRYGRAVFFARK
jgi:tRNA (mo5U34)-methyltransferase